MSLTQEIIDATVEPDGTLRLSHQPEIPPGPVRVTIQSILPHGRTLADVIREIAAEQRAQGFAGRSAEELQAEDELQACEDEERDREIGVARRSTQVGGA